MSLVDFIVDDLCVVCVELTIQRPWRTTIVLAILGWVQSSTSHTMFIMMTAHM